MASEQPQSEQQPEAQKPLLGVETTDNTKKPGLRRSRLKRILIIALTLIVFAGIIFAGIKLFKKASHSDLYGQVGTYKLKRSDVNRLVVSSKPYTEKQIGDTMLEESLYEQAGRQYSVSVSDEEVQGEILKETGRKDPSGKEFLTIQVKRTLLKQKLEAALKGYTKGDFIIAHFDQSIKIEGASFSPEEQARTDAQWQRLLVNSKNYATNFINGLKAKLDNGTLSFEQAEIAELSDPILGQPSLPTILHSGTFDTTDPGQGAVIFYDQANFKKAASTTPIGEISAPFLGQVDTSLDGKSPQADGYWLLIRVSDRKAGISGYKSLDDLIKSSKDKLHYAVYN